MPPHPAPLSLLGIEVVPKMILDGVLIDEITSDTSIASIKDYGRTV